MKNNIDFYQHYATSDQHPKFKMLRVELGWAGEGKFWALNNRIAQSENCCLDISKKYNKAAIASDLDFTSKEFDEFILLLLDDCELIMECSPGVITTDIVQENFQRVQGNRESARVRKQRSLEKVLKGSGELCDSSGDQNNKVKESKVKVKVKVNKTPSNGDDDSFQEFWKLYSKPVDKKGCESKWKKITKKNKDLIFENLPAYVESTPNKKYRKNPARYLNSEAWNDEISIKNNNGKAQESVKWENVF